MSAMRQGDQYKVNFKTLFSNEMRERLKSSLEINNVDRIAALQDSTTSSLCKSGQKKIILQNSVAFHGDFLTAATSIDASHNTAIYNVFDRELLKKRTDIPKDNLGMAHKINFLFDLMEIFLLKFKEKLDISAQTMRSTRGKDSAQDPITLQIAEELATLKSNLDKQIHAKKAGKINKMFKPPKGDKV